MNLYAYVGNDPLNKTDPSGLAQCDKSLQGAKCDQALDDSDKARDNARNVATGLTDIAGRMKNGKLTAQDKTDLAAVEKKFGSKFTTEKGLTKLANGLNGAADKIGAIGACATLTAGSATATYPARANSFTQTVILHDRYFKTSDSDTREQYMLHESAHLNWKWGDQYIENGVNPLFNSDRAFNNADTYSCAVYPSVCGF